MSSKTATIQARIQPKLKAQTEKVLDKLGLTISEAISLYFSQIALQKGLPFEVKIPNTATQQAMRDAKAGKTKRYKSTKDLLSDLDAA